MQEKQIALTIEDLATVLPIGLETVKRWRKRDTIPFRRTPYTGPRSRFLFTPRELVGLTCGAAFFTASEGGTAGVRLARHVRTLYDSIQETFKAFDSLADIREEYRVDINLWCYIASESGLPRVTMTRTNKAPAPAAVNLLQLEKKFSKLCSRKKSPTTKELAAVMQ